VGWTGNDPDIKVAQQNQQDVKVDFSVTTTPIAQALAVSSATAVAQINLLLFAGRMSAGLRTRILDAMQNQVNPNASTRNKDRLQIAVFIALSSSEYMIER
jgi:predicted NBD/HSP70 family sugar kinase